MCNRIHLNLVEKLDDKWDRPRAPFFPNERPEKGCYVVVYGHKIPGWLCSKFKERDKHEYTEDKWHEES
jgi:pyruvate carboxylase